MKNTILLFLFTLFGTTVFGQTLLASYPMTADLSADAGGYGNITSYNGLPLPMPSGSLCQSGGMFSAAQTPNIGTIVPTSFQMEIDFNLNNLPAAEMPIICGGGGSTVWIGIVVDNNGKVGVRYNEFTSGGVYWSNTNVTTATWYSSVLKFDSGHLILELDGNVIYEDCVDDLYWSSDFVFTTRSLASGTALDGCIKNLKLYKDISLPMLSVTNTYTLCNGESVFVGGNTYSTTGIYYDTITMFPYPCQQQVITDLTVLPPIANTANEEICFGDSLAIGPPGFEVFYSTSGTYDLFFTSIEGCDSIVTLSLTVLPENTVTTAATICEGDSIEVGGNFYSNTGTYTDVLQTNLGCDSIVTLNLTVLPENSVTYTIAICEGDSIEVGSNYYSTTGTYTDVLQTNFGCDSIVTTDLTVTTPNTSVTQNGQQLTAQATGASFQWIDCLNFAAIPGETFNIFNADYNGSYAVEVTQNGCIATSDCYEVEGVGMLENFITGMKMYPNPVKNLLTLENPEEHEVTLDLIDVQGRSLHQASTMEKTILINTEKLSKGTYFLSIQRNGKHISVPFIKE